MTTQFKINLLDEFHPLYAEASFAINMAVEAGKIITKIRKKNYTITAKGGDTNNPVTEADEKASDFLVSAFKEAFPNDQIISEEAELFDPSLTDKRTWYIDPIDGTKEFIKGINEWSIMIGLEENGKPIAGVVYQPDLQDLYFAVQGGGAFYSAAHGEFQRIKVRSLDDLSDAILIQSRSHWCEKAEQKANDLNITNSMRHGSIGLKLGLISRGIADLYFNFSRHCHLWDLCGPEIILREAGGKILTDSGIPIDYHSNNTKIDQCFSGGSVQVISSLKI